MNGISNEINELYNIVSEIVKDSLPLAIQINKDIIRSVTKDKEMIELVKDFIKFKIKLIKFAYDEAVKNGFDSKTALVIALKLSDSLDNLQMEDVYLYLGEEFLEMFKDLIK